MNFLKAALVIMSLILQICNADDEQEITLSLANYSFKANLYQLILEQIGWYMDLF